MRTRKDRRVYQVTMDDFIVEHPFGAIWAGMGAGKTGGTLSALDKLLSFGEVKRVLVVAPKRVAKLSWPDELKAWTFTSDLTYRVHTGDRKKIEATINTASAVDIDLINWDNLPWLVDTFAKKKKTWLWDMVVLDESSVFKKPSTKRFRALRKIRRIVNRLLELTGTPSSNGLLPLWTQAFLLDQGDRLFKTYGAYQTAFFDVENPFSERPKLVPKVDAFDRISAKLADVVLAIDPTDYLDVEENLYNPIKVELTPKLRERYDEFEDELYLEMGKTDDDIEAPNVAVLKNKLQQFCNGAIYDHRRDVHELHTLKLDALKELQETSTSPFLVAFSYRHDWARIKQTLGKAATLFGDDPSILDRWNAGELPFLCAHPASIGHGLSLQHGSNQTLWFGATYNLEHFLQFNERVGGVRQAQSGYARPLVCHSIVVANSVEEEIAAAIASKTATQEGLKNAVKNRRR
ncbi:MAG: DEAD/DEAH box helicase [Planctomycetes bacterium]|nr:DEAD/DEAH box helicase [Planctomycetota bacterium]